MKKYLFTIFSIIFILSAVLLVFSLPQCGHGGFSMGAAMDSTGAKSCGGNMYDQHLAFLQTIFLAKLEWIIFLLISLLIAAAATVVYVQLDSMLNEHRIEKFKNHYYRLTKSFDTLALQFHSGTIFQKLLE
ncbi:hypothetical protein KKA15_06490 [Patescibacteria group bacterium]|nr:hypothetical protein [Patescibacteria group bacterium]